MKSQQIWLKPWQIKGNTYKSHLPKSKTWRKASKFGAGVEEDWSGTLSFTTTIRARMPRYAKTLHGTGI